MNVKSGTISLLMTLVLCCSVSTVFAVTDRPDSIARLITNTTERRVALVIGNGSYAEVPLVNSGNDADAMSHALKESGFEVIIRKNAGRMEMFSAIREFGDKLKKSDVGLFYYAGYGVQIDKANYLLPVDLRGSDLNYADDLKHATVPLNELMDKLREAGTRNIVILDACRDNPLLARLSLSGTRGFAQVTTPAETAILYATEPGNTVSNGAGGENGAFTNRLVEAMHKEGLELVDVMREVALTINSDTGGKQKPVIGGVLTAKFYFHSPSRVASAEETKQVALADDPESMELGLWQGAQKANSPAAYRAYLKKYPNGVYAERANIIITSLERGKPVASAPVPVPAAVITKSPFSDPTIGMEFVPVKGGCFQMGDTFGDGDADEKPLHEACVSDFAMGKYEVTVTQFRRFVKATGYKTEAEKGGSCRVWSGRAWENKSGLSWQNPGYSLEESHPVTCVSWNDATSFATWLSGTGGTRYRLPTEAEWEYAARSGGKSEKYSGGNDVNAVAWYDKNSGRKTHPVGQKLGNGLGIFDMSGNVWEWTGDWFAGYSSDRQQNPTGASTGANRVFRGGGWGTIARHVRASNRGGNAPGGCAYSLGFRLVSPVR
jgi:formylglycine-generating enzyme required for sulfatase activity